MALVVNALASYWSKAEQAIGLQAAVDEKRPVERAGASSRRHSSGSGSTNSNSNSNSNADTWESSLSSFTSASSQLPIQGAPNKPKNKQNKKQKKAPAEFFVLHVQDCAFPLRLHMIKRKCPVLYNFLRQLRVQRTAGGGDEDNEEEEEDPHEPTSMAATTAGALPSLDDLHWTPHVPDHDDSNKNINTSRILLRQRDPLAIARATPSTTRTRCALLPRQQLSDRATASGSITRVGKLCCLAHPKQQDDPQRATGEPVAVGDRQPSSQDDLHSPGKENYRSSPPSPPPLLSASTTAKPHGGAMTRVALAPKMPFLAFLEQTPAPSHYQPQCVAASAAPASTRTTESPRRKPINVELLGASAEAVAVLLEYLHFGTTTGLHHSNAVGVTTLCKWLCMEDRLLYGALVVRTNNLHSVTQWMDLLLASTSLRRHTTGKRPYQQILIDHLLYRLMDLTPHQYLTTMQQMPLERLSAIENGDLLARVMTCMVNHLRRVEIWHRLTTALELWLFWTFHRPFAAATATISAVSDDSDSVQQPPRQPMNLVDFHRQYVSWDPVVRINGYEISGLDAYVAPTTLFTFGSYAFQVRLEPANQKELMLWRVARCGTPSDEDHQDQQDRGRRHDERWDGAPAFTVRGRLCVQFCRGTRRAIVQEEVAVRYTHTPESYNKWQVLVAATTPTTPTPTKPTNPTPTTNVGGRTRRSESESEQKTHEPDSSLEQDEDEESAPHVNSSDDNHDSTETVVVDEPLVPRRRRRYGDDDGDGDDEDAAAFEPLMTRFSGQFFVWGHRLCNLYHFLLLTTLFYQVPADAPMELRVDATLARMRELPVETLLVVLDSDRLRVPEGETTLAVTLSALCLGRYGTMQFSIDQIRALFKCVRWCFVDLEQIMVMLEHARRELLLYELVEQQLHAHTGSSMAERRVPWGTSDHETPYRATTTLIEFQIEAGDRSLSPSKFLFSQEEGRGYQY